MGLSSHFLAIYLKMKDVMLMKLRNLKLMDGVQMRSLPSTSITTMSDQLRMAWIQHTMNLCIQPTDLKLPKTITK